MNNNCHCGNLLNTKKEREEELCKECNDTLEVKLPLNPFYI